MWSHISQTSGHNGLPRIGLRPFFHPKVCDLFTNTVLKSSPLLLHWLAVYSAEP